MAIDWSLYLVTDPDLAGGRENVVRIVKEAVRGGVSVVQLRDKETSDEQIEHTARELLAVLGNVPLFINDRVEVAAKLGCHLHIGQGDMAFREARGMLSDEQLIGLSIGNHAELAAMSDDARPDVIGIGPVYSTNTKKNAPAGWGQMQQQPSPAPHGNAALIPSPSAALKTITRTSWREATLPAFA